MPHVAPPPSHHLDLFVSMFFSFSLLLFFSFSLSFFFFSSFPLSLFLFFIIPSYCFFSVTYILSLSDFCFLVLIRFFSYIVLLVITIHASVSTLYTSLRHFAYILFFLFLAGYFFYSLSPFYGSTHQSYSHPIYFLNFFLLLFQLVESSGLLIFDSIFYSDSLDVLPCYFKFSHNFVCFNMLCLLN